MSHSLAHNHICNSKVFENTIKRKVPEKNNSSKEIIIHYAFLRSAQNVPKSVMKNHPSISTSPVSRKVHKCVLKLATSSGKKFARKVPTFLRNRNSFPARRTHSRCNDSRDAPGSFLFAAQSSSSSSK